MVTAVDDVVISDYHNFMASYGKRRVYGVAEIAEALGARRQTVAQWRRRGLFPEPDEMLATGPVWFAETIGPWIEDWRVWKAVEKGIPDGGTTIDLDVATPEGQEFLVRLSWKLAAGVGDREQFVVDSLRNPRHRRRMRQLHDAGITTVLWRTSSGGDIVRIDPDLQDQEADA